MEMDVDQRDDNKEDQDKQDERFLPTLTQQKVSIKVRALS